MSTPMPTNDPGRQLRDAFLGDTHGSEALDANRAGHLSPAQRNVLWVRIARDLLAGLLPAGFGACFGCTAAWMMFAAGGEQGSWILFVFLLIGVALLVPALVVLPRAARTVLDIRQDRVDQGEGEVTWQGSAYTARLSDWSQPRGRQLNPLSGVERMQPGRYRFYYLSRSGWLLYQDWQGSLPEGTVEALSDALAHGNGFGPAELAANREGTLTFRQVIGGLAWAAALGGMMLFTFGLTGLILYQAYRELTTPGGQPLIGITAIITLAVTILAARSLAPLVADLAMGRAECVEGEGFKWARQGSGRNSQRTYYYKIAGQTVQVSSGGYNALVDGQRYRMYYLPHSSRFLSIEPAGAIGLEAGPRI